MERKTTYSWPYRSIEDVREEIPELIEHGAIEDTIEVLYDLKENWFYIRYQYEELKGF